MKLLKKAAAILLCAVIAAGTMTACGKQALLEEQSKNYIANFEPLQTGDKVAIITVKDYGVIKIKLFPELAPKAVENFTGLADMGYYDELIFHRVIEGFMAQGGDPRGDGTGGNSVWGGDFDLETPTQLYHFTGALAYAHSQVGGNGSQFYIVNSQPGMTYLSGEAPLTDEILDMCNAEMAEDVKTTYKEKGGMPYLDGGYTVFGQVVEGMDVVYALSAVEVDENDKPKKQVLIEKVEVIDYQGE